VKLLKMALWRHIVVTQNPVSSDTKPKYLNSILYTPL
jgi:hypothetical protein